MSAILLAILLILLGLGWLGIFSAPDIVLGLLALIAGVLMLLPAVDTAIASLLRRKPQ